MQKPQGSRWPERNLKQTFSYKAVLNTRLLPCIFAETLLRIYGRRVQTLNSTMGSTTSRPVTLIETIHSSHLTYFISKVHNPWSRDAIKHIRTQQLRLKVTGISAADMCYTLT